MLPDDEITGLQIYYSSGSNGVLQIDIKSRNQPLFSVGRSTLSTPSKKWQFSNTESALMGFWGKESSSRIEQLGIVIHNLKCFHDDDEHADHAEHKDVNPAVIYVPIIVVLVILLFIITLSLLIACIMQVLGVSCGCCSLWPFSFLVRKYVKTK